ncbi:MAG: DUF1385 domain-containing protein [Deltaproteobacteria bacterium]|jgi:uncharacterized protein YqhQ|nr:DUF1385 domain-containing protein [Deltaproteobacteria bacterium]
MMPKQQAPKTALVKKAMKNALLAWPAQALNPTGLSAQTPGENPESQKTVGGQAVIEGVMMRGQSLWSVMVREPNGQITGQTKAHKSWSSCKPWKYPFARGLAVLVESLYLGIKALNFSTDVAIKASLEEEKETKAANKATKTSERLSEPSHGTETQALASQGHAGESQDNGQPTSAQDKGLSPNKTSETGSAEEKGPIEVNGKRAKEKSFPALYIILSMALGLGLGLVIFVALPHVLTLWLGSFGGFDESTFLFHLIDGLVKFSIFLAYIWLIGLMPDIARVYAYHGAEHKAIYVYEAGLPLEPISARQFPTWHPRCGTAFLFLVLAASLLFFAIVFPLLPSFGELSRVPRALAGVGLKTLFTPFLASIAYELTKLASKPGAGRLWRAMVWPGLLLQRLTTREPDDSMLEVAFKSLGEVTPQAH